MFRNLIGSNSKQSVAILYYSSEFSQLVLRFLGQLWHRR